MMYFEFYLSSFNKTIQYPVIENKYLLEISFLQQITVYVYIYLYTFGEGEGKRYVFKYYKFSVRNVQITIALHTSQAFLYIPS